MSMRIVRGLVEGVEPVGVSRQELLRAAQLEPSQLDHEEACVPRTVIYRLCEAALDLTGDPAFGLHWGERLAESTFNPVSHLVAHSATLVSGRRASRDARLPLPVAPRDGLRGLPAIGPDEIRRAAGAGRIRRATG
jgi:hypothetical protein